MSDQTNQERSLFGIMQLSLRSLIFGALGSILITASSMYVALRMSALPWPTIFVAVLSMALLKALGKTTLNEINITQTAMSAGAMVAGGLAFTLPGLWINGIWEGQAYTTGRLWQVIGIALAGVILGSVLTWFLRQRFIDHEALPFPIGKAAADTIVVGDAGGKKSALLFGTMGLSAIFTFLRDNLGWIPAAISSKWLYAKNFQLGFWMSPMAVGIGYIIGTLYTGVWFIGALLSYVIIIPLGTALNLFPTVQEAVSFKNTLGIGLMVGTGIGVLLAYFVSLLKKKNNTVVKNEALVDVPKANKKKVRVWALLGTAVAFVITVACGIGPLPSFLLMLGVLLASAMAAIISGETGINPMEIFGIIVLLAVRLIVPVDAFTSFMVAAAVAVACGYSGDMLFDYKAGRMLGTNPVAQMISQIVGGLAGAVVAALAMFAVVGQFGGVGPDKGLPAGQAFMVSQMINGVGAPVVFGIAVAIGALLYLLKVPVMTLGIGIYLPFEISAPMFLGGAIRFITDRLRPNSAGNGNIAASGLLGGEGITGVGIAIFKMITGG
ncbi:MAG: peptide transporter [Firmicutes bacterium]|nr:peptide transporter [Bacillota bacterium]